MLDFEYIPVDDVVLDFSKHLETHPRTILSARFGDGKSFFLSQAKEILSGEYVFLTVYPLNYQVVENRDIFELIKRDILFQLFGNGLVKDDYLVPKEVSVGLFLKNNWQEITQELLQDLSLLDGSNVLKTALGALTFLKRIKASYESFKSSEENNPEKRIDRFLEEFDESGLYETDPITLLIRDIIDKWRLENNDKKMVLVFEDMDRIDPAHIFRILNVISSHLDYSYRVGHSTEEIEIDNKFGVDNIVVCLDYSNLKTIFQHVYGAAGSAFDGYISKFSDKGYFSFSLKKHTEYYFYRRVSSAFRIADSDIRQLLPADIISSLTLRVFNHALDGCKNQIVTKDYSVPAHIGILGIMAFLRRLGKNDDEIVRVLLRSKADNPKVFIKYSGALISVLSFKSVKQYNLIMGATSANRYNTYYDVSIGEDGLSNVVEYASTNDQTPYIFNAFMMEALKFVGK